MIVGGMVPPIQVRDVVRTLTMDRREVFRGNESSPQQQLLILPVQNDQAHDEILVLAEEFADLLLC